MPRRTPLSLDRQFTYRLNTLSKLNDLASAAQYGAATGLSLPAARALAVIGSQPGLGINRLALEVNLDKGQASRLAASMVQQGLLERRPDPADARALRLVLTRRGKALWTRVMMQIEARNRALLRSLAPDEQAQLLAWMTRLVEQEQADRRG